MTKRNLNLLVDTNVWLDHFLGRDKCEDSSMFLRKAIENEDVVAVTPSITKDVFYLICMALKRRMPNSDEITEYDAKAINEIGWTCISSIQRLAIMLPQGFGEHLEAVVLRDDNKDYEDNLLLATSKNAKIDYIVTNDRGLLKNKIVPVIIPKEYLELNR